jgi:preprotein translocase subunit SecD
VRVEFVCAKKSPAKGLIEATVSHTNEKVYLHRKVRTDVVTNEDMVGARVVKSDNSESYEVEVQFTKEGAKKMARITTGCIKRRLAILIDGDVISAPIVNSQIYDKASLVGAIGKDEAEKIADAVNCCRTRIARRSAQSSARIPLGRIDIEFRAAEREPTKGLKQVTVTDTGEKVYLRKEPIITNRDIVEARALKSLYGDSFAVEITFTNEAANRMSNMSRYHKGKPLAILMNGRVISAPIVASAIHDKVEIYVKFTRDEAERIAQRLNGK